MEWLTPAFYFNRDFVEHTMYHNCRGGMSAPIASGNPAVISESVRPIFYAVQLAHIQHKWGAAHVSYHFIDQKLYCMLQHGESAHKIILLEPERQFMRFRSDEYAFLEPYKNELAGALPGALSEACDIVLMYCWHQLLLPVVQELGAMQHAA